MDTKRLGGPCPRRCWQKSVLASAPSTIAWCLQLHGKWHPHGVPCHTRWYEYCNGVANPGLWMSKTQGSKQLSKHLSPHTIFLSRMSPSSKISRCNSTFVSDFALQFLIVQICNVRFNDIIVQFFESRLANIVWSNIALQILTVQKLELRVHSFEFRLYCVVVIERFPINFRYSQCSLFGGRVSQYLVCSLLQRFCRTTVVREQSRVA